VAVVSRSLAATVSSRSGINSIQWRADGRAGETNALQPPDAKERHGTISGKHATQSGRLDAMGSKAIETVREIAERWRSRRRS
jgi:hypothetical protein